MTCADVLGLGGGRGERRRLPPEVWATKLSKRESRAPPVQLCQQAAGQTRMVPDGFPGDSSRHVLSFGNNKGCAWGTPDWRLEGSVVR